MSNKSELFIHAAAMYDLTTNQRKKYCELHFKVEYKIFLNTFMNNFGIDFDRC